MASRLPFNRPANPDDCRPRLDAGKDVTADLLGESGVRAQPPAASECSPVAAAAGRPAMSVTALVTQIKRALVEAFPQRVCVVGEISNLKMHSSGHAYFRLKDAGATIDAVMFRSAAARLKFRPADGLEVVVEGKVDVYDSRGQLQFYVESMTPKGAGALELAFRQLCQKLQAEGVFDPAHKVPLPRVPRAIGLVTSPTGAAIRDIRRTLSRRWPAAEVYLVPTLVQGDGAAQSVARAIGMLDANAGKFGIDTIIVARGGGSLEDLWAFNEEVVARAVWACRTPIISGIGHEVDVTICDMAADIRAATPTAAAEIAVPDRVDVLRSLGVLAGRLSRRTREHLQSCRQCLEAVGRSVVFRDPTWKLRSAAQRMDELSHRLRGSAARMITRDRQRLEPAVRRLAGLHPARLRERAQAHLDRLIARLTWVLGARSKQANDRMVALRGRLLASNPALRVARAKAGLDRMLARMDWAFGGTSKRAGDSLAAMAGRLAAADPRHRLALASQKIEAISRHLESLSYHSVLGRGFSVTRGSDGQILRSSEQVKAGDKIATELAAGSVASVVDGEARVQPAPVQKQRRKAKQDDQPNLFESGETK